MFSLFALRRAGGFDWMFQLSYDDVAGVIDGNDFTVAGTF